MKITSAFTFHPANMVDSSAICTGTRVNRSPSPSRLVKILCSPPSVGSKCPTAQVNTTSLVGFAGRAHPVIVSDLTGLPIPSTGEIVIEGFMHPNDDRDEGPFGEWTGYYAGGRKPAPQITIERIRYRTNPILLGVLTGRPPTDDTYYRGVLRSAMIWEQLEASGIPGITGVWVHEASGGR